MVEMMDGTDTIYGPQVGSAIFGYVIGIACAISSCICGSHFVQCLRQGHPLPQSSESENFIATNVPEKQLIIGSRHITRAVVIVLLCAGLFGSYIVADVRYESILYRELWLASLMAPFGALIRWRLRTLNARPACAKRTTWFPWGTFTANFAASIISILFTALKTYIVEPRDISSNWLLPVLVAVNIGFTGSLSTASSLAHELVVLETIYQSYCYAFATIICSMLVSVMIYVPIARFG
jgi:fluoride ion exporter CrcB/FEX